MALILTTTMAAETGHNTSANALYDKDHFAANFTGITTIDISDTTMVVDSTKSDDSLNPVTPCHVSPVSIRTMCPNFLGDYYAHLTPWWHLGGGGGHIDIGLNNDSDAWVINMLDDLIRRDFGGVTIDWYGSSNFVNGPTLRIKTQIASRVGFTYAIMMDQGGYTDTASLQANFTYLTATYFGTTNYRTIGGKPVVLFFGTVPGVNYATVKAAFPNTYWIMQGPGQLANSYCDGVMDWVQPYTTGVPADRYNIAAMNSFLNSTHSTAKGVMPCLAPRFNGYLTKVDTWSRDKYLPGDNGKCWLTQAATINANLPNNCIGIQVATWQDYEEGTEIETGIDNGVTVSAGISGHTLTWSVADESTISFYRILATPDGIGAWRSPDIGIGGSHAFDLESVPGWDGTAYQISVIAVGKASIRNQSSVSLPYAALPFTVSGVTLPLLGGGGTMNFHIRNFAVIKQQNPPLGELLEDILIRLGTVAGQTNANPEGTGPVPSPISQLTVSAASGTFDIQIQDNSPITRGMYYHIEASLTKSFTTPFLIYTGPARNFRTFLGNQTYYFRAFSQYATGDPSDPVYFGGANNPTAVVGGGTISGPVPQASAGSGTGRTNGLDGGVGFGRNPRRGF